MQKIYYYSCPIRAAYMAKEFGMMFGIKHNGKLVWDWIDMLNTPHPARTAIDILEDYPDEPRGHLYVHPNSLHILEPKDDDVCELWGDDDTFSNVTGDVANIYRENNRWRAVGLNSESFLNEKDGGVAKIIQRNNRPFFMPEVETI